MSQVKFYFTSFMLNMFRTLIHPSSGTCDFSIVSLYWSCVLVSMCVGVSVWLGWSGSMCSRLKPATHVSDINTSIIRSLRLFYCVTLLVVRSCFDVCWSFGVAGLEWYPCSRLKPATHVSDINTSIIRSLRLFYCVTILVVRSCFDVCWSFGVAGLGWYPCSRLKHCFSLLHMFRTSIHASSGACDFSVVSPHWSCVL